MLLLLLVRRQRLQRTGARSLKSVTTKIGSSFAPGLKLQRPDCFTVFYAPKFPNKNSNSLKFGEHKNVSLFNLETVCQDPFWYSILIHEQIETEDLKINGSYRNLNSVKSFSQLSVVVVVVDGFLAKKWSIGSSRFFLALHPFLFQWEFLDCDRHVIKGSVTAAKTMVLSFQVPSRQFWSSKPQLD